MTQLTIRNQSKELDEELHKLANERGWSLNQAANFLMRKGAKLEKKPTHQGVGDQLDTFIGSWTPKEAKDIMNRIGKSCNSIDEDLWK